MTYRPIAALAALVLSASVSAQQAPPPSPQLPPPLKSTAGQQRDGSQNRASRRNMQLSGLLDYMDREVEDAVADIDTPVTGFANEALWELTAERERPPNIAAMTKSKRREGSTRPVSPR